MSAAGEDRHGVKRKAAQRREARLPRDFLQAEDSKAAESKDTDAAAADLDDIHVIG
jgi:hypothetical protein